MGIMLGKIAQRKDLFIKAVNSYNREPVTDEPISDKEAFKIELINTFDQANILLQESAELQMRANACQQQAMLLQKEALLKNLNCL